MLYRLIKSIYRTINHVFNTMSTWYWTWRACIAVASYQTKPHVNFKSTFSNNTHLGKNTHFNGMNISGQGEVKFGDNFHSGRNCKIITSFHNYYGKKIPYDETSIHRNVVIEDNVWLGDDIIILGGVTIGEGAIIQAGSVVVKSVPKLAIAGGHPAVPFKYRDEEHYYKLKEAKQFK